MHAFLLISKQLLVTKQQDWIYNEFKYYVAPKRQSLSTPPIPAALYHVLVSPAEALRLCSLIFHYGNMLPKRKWACSVQHHLHHLNLNCNCGQKEDQTWLIAEDWPHKLWSENRRENRRWVRASSHLCVTFHYCWVFSVENHQSRQKGQRVTKSTLIRLVPVRCVQFGPAVVIAVLSVWSQKTTQTQYHSYCQSQTSRMANEIIFSLSVCVSVFLVIRPRYHAVFL